MMEAVRSRICISWIAGLGLACSLGSAIPAYAATCGNGVVEAGEECDDGDVAPGDGCDPTCLIALGDCPTGMTGLWKFDADPDTSVRSLSIIDNLDGTFDMVLTFQGEIIVSTGTRNGTVLTVGGNPGSWLPCGKMSTFGGPLTRLSSLLCGDGQVTGGEECDDGNWVSDDGCDINCTLTACGNHVVTAGEQCDDGNLLPGDGCNVSCHLLECGDGERTPGQYVTCGAGPTGTCSKDVCDAGWSTPFDSTPFLDGEANSILPDGDDYYFGGYFFTGGFASIARWNNGTWASVGKGFGDENSVDVLAKLGTDIYAAGELTEVRGTGVPLSGLAKWNGSAWSSVGGGVTSGTPGGRVLAMLASGSDLFVAGFFDHAGAVPAVGIARWDGTAWHAVGGDLLQANSDPGLGSSLVRIGSDIYVAGSFATAGGVTASNVAKWDGFAWSALGAGTPEVVQSLATDGTRLYAGGPGFVMQWDGVAWTTLWDYLVDAEPGDPFTEVRELLALDGKLYAAGAKIGGATGLARWDGTRWSPLGSGLAKDDPLFGPDLQIHDMVVDSHRVILVGHYIDTVGGRPASDAAVWTESGCGEQCDDGNPVDGDGCDSNCSVTSCGNGIATAGELCDDGNLVSGDGCDNNCTATACGNGIATVGETCDDGNAVPGDGCESNCKITTVSEAAAPGGTVSSPPPTESFPVQAAITSPTGGTVSIGEASASVPPSGYAVLGTVLEITAPDESTVVPLQIGITVHKSSIPPGYDPERLSVSRDGVTINDCSGTPGQASPDPCIANRLVLADTVEITVLSSHASEWAAMGRGLVGAEQGCVLGATKAVTGVTTAYVKNGAKCLKLAQADKVDLRACLSVAAVGKTGKVMKKTVKSMVKCPLGVPFGFAGTSEANLAGIAAGQQLVADVLGDDIAATIESNPEGAACRSAAVGGIGKIVASKSASYMACELAGFSAPGSPFLSGRDIASCLESVRTDAGGSVAKAVATFSKKLASKCVPASLLSGPCSTVGDTVACLEARIDCRFCGMMRSVAGFEYSCDRYDDGSLNNSCH
jgi:cysteine-rich repeat protein